mmetsp:Transcript_3281/g.7454  ORF Transcript_3281/g.7454 Transcript_3281/m.7454 type:complete len:390 (-) Transcript_3281:54-1223(-)
MSGRTMQIDPEDPEDTVAARPAARPIGGVNKDALTRPRKDSWMMIQNVVKSAQAEPTVVAPAATSGSNSPLGSLLAAPNKAWTKAKSLVSSKSFRALISSMPDAVEVEREQKRVSWQRLKADRDRKDALFEQIVFALRAQYKAAIRRSDHATQCSVSVNISRSYFKAGRLPEAETWLTQALDICVEQDLSKPIFLGALRSLVQFHLEAPNPPKAITNGTVLLRAAQDAEDEHYQGEAYRLLAAAHMAQGDRETAQNMDVKHLALALKEARWEVETLSDSACGRLIKGDAVRGDSAAAWEALGLQPGPVGHHSAAGRYLSSLGTSHTSLVTSRTASVINGNNPILARISSTARRASVASMSVPSINANVPSINANNPIFARISSAGKQPA